MAEGDVYYSAKADRFYQEGRRGAVGRDTAVRNLLYDRETDTFVDSRGRTIDRQLLSTASRSQQTFTAQDVSGRTFVNTRVTSRVITDAEARTIRVRQNQDVTVRIVVTTPDGRTHVFTRSAGLGRNVDPAKLQEEAQKLARGALGKTKDPAGNTYDVSTNQIKNSTVTTDYYIRTISSR